MKRFLFVVFLLLTIIAVFAQDGVDYSKLINNIDINEYVFEDDVIDLRALEQEAGRAYQAGDYEKAAKFYILLLQNAGEDRIYLYNLACCHALLGNIEPACDLLIRSYNAGFDDLEHIKNDPDFSKIRDTKEFELTYAELERCVIEADNRAGSILFIDSNTMLHCRMQLPEDFDKEKEYTLLVGLHGYGGTPEGLIGLWQDFESKDFIFVTPQAPYPFIVGGNRIGYSWNETISGDEQLRNYSAEITENYIAEVIDNFKKAYNIGDVYLLGFSQGGAFSYRAGFIHHDKVDGIICFGGYMMRERITDKILEEAEDTRVYIAHGFEDRAVVIAEADNAAQALDKAKIDFKLDKFEGGHIIERNALNRAIKWMLEK